ncbi:MAG: hypothetical protein ACRDF4_10335, partial [Rhabdochlamydiaceae bacterium]
ELELIGTEDKFLMQIRFESDFIVASFDERSAKQLKRELDEWLADKSQRRQRTRSFPRARRPAET